MHLAAKYGSPEVIKVLIKAGARKEAKLRSAEDALDPSVKIDNIEALKGLKKPYYRVVKPV